ncbi:unnamed protein product, partial [Dicrocoelium dendriticum]
AFTSPSPIMFSSIKSAHMNCLLRAGSVALTLYTTCATSSSNAPFGNVTLHALIDSLEYALLPYTFYFGPLITYEDWITYRSGKITVSPLQFIHLLPPFLCLRRTYIRQLLTQFALLFFSC